MKAVVAGLLVLSFAAPANAHQITGTEVTFDGAIPCSVACAYWVENGFSPCEQPFPPGSYVDHITSPAPSLAGKKTFIQATLDPEIDWDMFFCRNDATRAELDPGMCACLPPECQTEVAYVVGFGCHEDFFHPLVAGQTTIFRAYNWSDAAPAIGRYNFVFL
jgi:hypothetical protein